jgi:hypothetical protein
MKSEFALAALGFAAFGLAACDDAAMVADAPVAGTPTIQEQACLAAVSNETDNGDVAVLNSEFSEANSVVMIGVGADRAPWRCLVSNDGEVAEVSFSGSEGFL